MDIISVAKHVRISPRKLRVIARSLAMTPVPQAEKKLTIMGGKSAKLLLSSIDTASADAIHNFKKTKDNLTIKVIEILEGMKMKRFQPVARGGAHSYKHRTSHIKVVLTDAIKEMKK